MEIGPLHIATHPTSMLALTLDTDPIPYRVGQLIHEYIHNRDHNEHGSCWRVDGYEGFSTDDGKVAWHITVSPVTPTR